MRQTARFTLLLLVCSITQAWSQTVSLVTWNIRDLGRTKDDTEIAAMAGILRDADLVAIQEVVARDPAGAQAVARLADALDRTGADWDYVVSDPTTGSPARSERYAFLWKASRVRPLEHPRLIHELASGVQREPYAGRFRTPAGEIVAVNFHAIPYDQQPEREIVQVRSLADAFGEVPVVFLADWNVVDHHTVFNPLKRTGYRFALTGEPTTLKQACRTGDYRHHAIDNILLPPGLDLRSAGVLDFVGDCGRLEAAREISDHLPVRAEVRR